MAMTLRILVLMSCLMLALFSLGQSPVTGDGANRDTILLTSPDYSSLDRKAREFRNALWPNLMAGNEPRPREIHARVGHVRKKGVQLRDILSNREKTLLRFWTRQYDSLLTEPFSGIDAHQGYYNMRPKCFNGCYIWDPSDSLNAQLLAFMYERREILQNDISASSLSASDKDFLAMYLRSVFAYRDLAAFSTDSMLQETARFLDNHPGSAQELYVRKTLDQRYKPGGFGTGGYFFAGPSFFVGNMSKYFNDTWFIGGELSFSWAKAMIMAGFGGGLSRPIKAPFSYNDFAYTTETRTASGFGHALLGYAALDSRHLRITPFIGTAGVGFSAEEDNGNVVFYGRQAGVDIDWKFSHWQEVVSYPTAFGNKFHEGYWASRLRFGYEGLFHASDDATFGGSQVILRLGISYFEGYGRRVKTWKRRSK